jgi:hypothetical protein
MKEFNILNDKEYLAIHGYGSKCLDCIYRKKYLKQELAKLKKLVAKGDYPLYYLEYQLDNLKNRKFSLMGKKMKDYMVKCYEKLIREEKENQNKQSKKKKM